MESLVVGNDGIWKDTKLLDNDIVIVEVDKESDRQRLRLDAAGTDCCLRLVNADENVPILEPNPTKMSQNQRILKVSLHRLSDIEVETYTLRAKLRSLKESRVMAKDKDKMRTRQIKNKIPTNLKYPNELAKGSSPEIGIGKHLCNLCGLNYEIEEAHKPICQKYKKFQDSDTGKWLWKCGICDKATTRKREAINHLRIHTGEKPFICDICGTKFKDKRNLRIHERIHTDSRPFQCTVCAQSFISSSALITHRKVHDEPEFRCTYPECGKTFYAKIQLTFHEAIHKGEKWNCPICHEGFALANRLRHKRRCFKRFNQNANYIKLYESLLSAKNQESGVLHCNLCLSALNSEEEMTSHKQICQQFCQLEPNIFRCGICKKIKRNTLNEMKFHLKYHVADKTYKCNSCSKSYRFQSELLRHEHLHKNNSTKKYICELCGTGYTNLYRFNVHRKIKHIQPDVLKEEEDPGPRTLRTNTKSITTKKKVKIKSACSRTPSPLPIVQSITSSPTLRTVYHVPIVHIPLTIRSNSLQTNHMDNKAGRSRSAEPLENVPYQVLLPTAQTKTLILEIGQQNDAIAQEHRYIMIQTQSHEQIDQTYFHVALPDLPKATLITENAQRVQTPTVNVMDTNIEPESVSTDNSNQAQEDDSGFTDPWDEFISSSQPKKKDLEFKPIIDTSGSFSKVGHHQWKCSECPKLTKRRLEMVSHFRVHTGEKPFVCDKCPNSFKDKRNLKIHQRSHTGEKPYVCLVCSMAFRHNAPFNTHKRSHGKSYEEMVQKLANSASQETSLGTIKSKISNKSLNKKTVRKVDDGTSATALLKSSFAYKCEVCFFGFESEMDLKSHDCRNYGPTIDKRWKCGYCGKTARKRLELVAHTRIHTGERPFSCIICSKKYKDVRCLRRHESISHLGQTKTFNCTICSKSFTTKYNRDIHERKHRSEKPFLCSTCGMDFFDKQTYRHHINRHEAGDDKYNCKYCDADLTTKHELFQHYQLIHPGKDKKTKKDLKER